MRIEFINHSGFVLECSGVRLISDPWLDGTVFNQGWDLISKTRFRYDDFAGITHIWLSHEHPDHFNPPNLRRIAENARKNISILFQETADHRVADFCRKLGFKEVIELKPDWFDLAPGLSLLCEGYETGDSWIAFRSGDMTLLNTNDCGIGYGLRARAIRQKVGRVDVLMTQFSYAYWVGNRNQREIRREIADEKLQYLKFQCDVLKPKVVIPIASFIRFCHQENHFLNDEINTPQKAYDFISGQTEAVPVILYPGDHYQYPERHDSASSLRKYEEDFRLIATASLVVPGHPVELQSLRIMAERFVRELTRDFGLFARFLRPAKIYLTDHQKSFILSVKRGMMEVSLAPESCDIALSSESLQYCFKFPYGADTLGVNGRYERPQRGHYSHFYNLFRFNQLRSRGTAVGLNYLLGMLLRKTAVKLGLQRY